MLFRVGALLALTLLAVVLARPQEQNDDLSLLFESTFNSTESDEVHDSSTSAEEPADDDETCSDECVPSYQCADFSSSEEHKCPRVRDVCCKPEHVLLSEAQPTPQQ